MNALKNQVTLIGNLGLDLEIKTVGQDKTLTRGTLATNEYYKNKEGEMVQDTQWHNIIAWGKLAENMARLTSKGDQVMIQGKITYRRYEDGEGRKQYITEIIVQEFMLMSKSSIKAA